jgi:hypothetical protein
MSVYVDFLKIDDLQITTSGKRFRDLEKDFLKKYNDKSIIGFFEYIQYPLKLKPVQITEPLDYTNKKYVIITDKAKFTNKTFENTFKDETKNAFFLNKYKIFHLLI